MLNRNSLPKTLHQKASPRHSWRNRINSREITKLRRDSHRQGRTTTHGRSCTKSTGGRASKNDHNKAVPVHPGLHPCVVSASCARPWGPVLAIIFLCFVFLDA
uniref:Uncharacterized protein n=1 Tax=Opuntia streptacantha TaxID=393608 RepID=A0A7C8YZW6_OPUST